MGCEVKIFKIINNESELYEQSNNMIVDKAGEVIADILTTPPGILDTVASAVLDTSNYTIRAMSLGKDSLGYQNHAHEASLSALRATDNIVRVVSYKANTVSSYHSSANTNYKLLPPYPDPRDTRLEMGNTVPPLGNELGLDSIGHNMNSILASSVPAYLDATLQVGCYAAGDGNSWAILSSLDSPEDPIVSGVFSSTYNKMGVIDYTGFINMTVSNASEGNSQILNSGGLKVKANPDFSSTGEVIYETLIEKGDLGMQGLYGGVYTVGLWCYDLKTLLSRGLYPPYLFNPLVPANYRLFGKKTVTKDLTYINDRYGNSGYMLYAEVPASSIQTLVQWVVRF